MLMACNVLSTFKLKFDCNKSLFSEEKNSRHGVYVVKNETSQEGYVQV